MLVWLSRQIMRIPYHPSRRHDDVEACYQPDDVSNSILCE